MKRIYLILLAAGLFLLGLLPPTLSPYGLTGEESLPAQVAGVVHWAHTAVRPQPLLAPNADLQHVDVPLAGVNVFLEQEVLPEVRDASLKQIKAAGFGFVRQEFVWEDIEIAAKGDFTDSRNDVTGDGQIDTIDAWAKYDNIVDLVEANDMELIVRISNPPAWSRAMTNTIGTLAPPDDFTDYADFVATLVDRYEGRIQYFQLWNEPNIYPEWGEQNVDPEAYTSLLCEASAADRAVNPNVVIIAAAMAPTINNDGRNMNDLIFLQRMYDAGAGDCFDILAAQGYGLFSGPTDQRLRPVVINYPHNLLLRDVMVRNGDAEKPIWISEMAWNVVPDGLPQTFGQVTEAQQAQYTVEAYERAAREWPWIGVVNYWFFKQASDLEINQPVYYFRLMEPNLTPLPVYTAVADYLGQGELDVVEPRSGLATNASHARPWLILLGGGLLFGLLLQAWAPPEEES